MARVTRSGVMVAAAMAAALAFTVLNRTAPAPRADTGRTAPAGTTGAPPASRQSAPAGASAGADARTASGRGAPVDPDSFFTPNRLAPGQRPPQFVIVSFDGAGFRTKWTYWRQVAAEAGARFTGFLTGVYLLNGAHRAAYHGPGHLAGTNSLGYWPTSDEVRQEIEDLNIAWSKGFEIGTHYNGHYCASDQPGADDWSTSQWNDELDQFFRFWTGYKHIDGLPDAPNLAIPRASVVGGRTPCLEGNRAQLFPALRAHGFSYDTSGTANGIAWPRRNSYGLWEFPLAYVPMAGTGSGVTSMDYNFWVKQTGNPPSTRDPVGDAQQVLSTYRQMYQAAYGGNRAPLVLGNHFNSWNGNAYTMALATFVRQTCHRPDTYCVPYRDVIRWMNAQDPAVLAGLQSLPPVDTPCPHPARRRRSHRWAAAATGQADSLAGHRDAMLGRLGAATGFAAFFNGVSQNVAQVFGPVPRSATSGCNRSASAPIRPGRCRPAPPGRYRARPASGLALSV